MADSREVRIARYEALFRVVNERVREVRPEEAGERLGILCECGDDKCTDTLDLSVDEYEEVRSDPTQFVVRPGHEITSVEEPLKCTARFLVVRKHPEEASIALDTDPRP